MRIFIQTFLIVWALLLFFYWLGRSELATYDSGTTHLAGGSLSSSSSPAETPQAADASLAASGGARLSGPVSPTPSRGEDPHIQEAGKRPGAESGSPEVAGSNPAWAAILNLYDYSTPSADDIAWLTIDNWSQEEFLTLTQEEAHELLALDDTMGMKGPGLMTSIVGPLPTLDDCRAGFSHVAVQAALRDVLLYEAVVSELGLVPVGRRQAGHARTLKAAIELRDAAMDTLMAELEEATTCGTWKLWSRMYRSWSR